MSETVKQNAGSTTANTEGTETIKNQKSKIENPSMRSITLIRTCAGAGWSHRAGETVSVPEERAAMLIRMGNAREG